MIELKLTRRDFIKSNAVAAAATVAGFGAPAALAQQKGKDDGVRWDKGVCRYCGTGCGVLVGVKDGRVVATQGDPDAPVNRGLNCIKGYFLSKIMYGKDRLTQPLLRMKDGKFDKNGDFKPVSWKQAFDIMEEKCKAALKEGGPKNVAMFGSGQWTVWEGYAAAKLFKAGFRSNNIDPNARHCMASAVAGFMRTFGIDEPMGCYDDAEHADVFALWGSNMAEMHPILWSRITNRRLTADHVRIHVLSTFSRKPTYGYEAQVYSFIAIGILSVIVWAHHFFTVGMPVPALIYFMFSTMSISLPLAVLFFCWIATMWRGAMSFETPMLFAQGFIVLFGMAGLTGLVLADVAADAQYHHSYFVVAHFHYALFAGGIMGVMTGVYYWLPKWTGHMYSETLGKWHFWLTVVSFNLTFMPQFFLGLAGMPRRIPDYALQFAEFNAISTVGAFILGISQLLFAWNVWQCVRGGKPVEGRVWEGAEGLEWELPSPPPHHSWEVQPEVK